MQSQQSRSGVDVVQFPLYSIASRFDGCCCVLRFSAGDVPWVIPCVDHVEQSSKLGFVGEELNLTQNSGPRLFDGGTAFDDCAKG